MDKLIRAFFLGFVSLAITANFAFAAVCGVNIGLIQPPNPDIQLNGVAGVPGLVIGVGEPDCKINPAPGCNRNNGVVYVNGVATALPANTAQLNGVSVASTNYAVAVGDNKFGTTPLVQFDGTTWTAMPTAGTGPSQDANGVKTYGPNQTYVVGDQGIYFFNGTTWTRQFNTGNVPNVNGQKAGKFEAIWGDANNVYALADNGALYTKAAAASPTTWTLITATYPAGANNANFQAITGDAAGNVYVTGQTNNNKGFVYQYNPTTGAWTNLITTLGAFDFNGIAINPVNGAITAAGDNGGQITSGPNGAGPWTQIPETNNTNNINAVYIDSNGTTYLAGQTAAGCTVPTGPDHILIQHTGSGLTCSPSTITLRACAQSVAADPTCANLYTGGGVTVTPSPAGVAVTIGATGIATTTVQQATAGAVTLSATANPAAAAATTCTVNNVANCVMNFSDAGFVVTVPNHTSCTNATATIEAVQKGGAGRCVPAYQNVTQPVNLSFAYTNPASGTQSINVLSGSNLAAITTAATTHTLTFDNVGTATLGLSYADAGQLTVTASGTAPTGAAMTGNGTFIAAPALFVFSGVTAGPIKAGTNFGATVTAMNNCATPAATPNFGKETPPESATLSFSKCQPTGTNAVNGAFVGSVGAFASGVATATNLNWDEVGNGDLVATNSTYLGSSLTVTGNTSVSGTVCKDAGGNSIAGKVGSFIPDHFITTVADGCAGCGFTYSGQPFTVTVTAMNGLATPAKTANYDGTANTTPKFANDVSLTDANAVATPVGKFGVSATPMGVTVNVAGDTLTVPKADFVSGVATLTSVPAYIFNVVPTAPAVVKVRAVDSVNASVSSSGFAEGTTTIRSGRIKVSNAHGSELLPLPLTATVQFWNGTFWGVSATDSVTSLTLAATYNVLNKSGVTTGTTTPTPAGAATVANGILNISLSRPTGGAGSATVIPMAPAYLPLTGGLATFGVYKGNNEFIYLRENY